MATNFVTASYQEIYDIGTKGATSTEPGKVTILGIHTPTGIRPRLMMHGFFDQYRFYKYSGCSFSCHAVQRLLADPSKVGFEDGEDIDPRDLINPIIFKGCHGEALDTILDSIYQDKGIDPTTGDKQDGFVHHSILNGSFDGSIDDMDIPAPNNRNDDCFYYSLLSDRSFKKYPAMSSFKLPPLYPMLHNVNALHPIVYNESRKDTTAGGIGIGDWNNSGTPIFGYPSGVVTKEVTLDDSKHLVTSGNNMQQTFMTNGLKKLGWLNTRDFFHGQGVGADQEKSINATFMPRIFMGLLMFPPAYKQEMYYRIVITHYFQFKGFTSALAGVTSPASPNSLWRGNQIDKVQICTYFNWLPDNVQLTDEDSIEIKNGTVEKATDGVA